jgi:hypothetical protein
MDSERKRRDGDIGEDKEINNVKVEFKIPVPEFIDPVFTKTSPKRSFLLWWLQFELFASCYESRWTTSMETWLVFH